MSVSQGSGRVYSGRRMANISNSGFGDWDMPGVNTNTISRAAMVID